MCYCKEDYRKDYKEEYKSMFTLAMIMSLLTMILLFWGLATTKRVNEYEKMISKKITIEIDNARYICDKTEVKETTWNKVK